MIRSMTGYGRGECILYNRKFTVEIKSVNHRYNDISIKMPKTVNPFEDKLRKIISASVFRGKVDVYISFETFSQEDIKISFNQVLADEYFKELTKIKERYGLKDEINIGLIAKFPDIINVEKNIDNETALNQMMESLETALLSALENFLKMREAEGEHLKGDLLVKTKLIESLVGKIKVRSPNVVLEHAEKMKNRIAEVFSEIELDENRLHQEIAFYADKLSIDEELTRLSSHIAQMCSILDESDSIGRKLDFLVQEMNREANTIGSKSNDIEITKIVVELKSEIEKIREQVQNIE